MDLTLKLTREPPKPHKIYLILVGGENPEDQPDGYLLAYWRDDHWVTQSDSDGNCEHIPNDKYDRHLKVVDVYAWAELPRGDTLGIFNHECNV